MGMAVVAAVLCSATTSLTCLGDTLDDTLWVRWQSSTKVPHHMQLVVRGGPLDSVVVISTWIHASITRQLTQVPHHIHMAVVYCQLSSAVATIHTHPVVKHL